MNENELDGLEHLVRGPAMLDAVLDLMDGEGVSLRGKADSNEARRRELLERSSRGEHLELSATILAYGQGGRFSNRKFTRFTPSALQQYARAAGTTLFQRDHSMSTADTGGIILSGKIELNGEERALHEEIRLAYPWAVQAALLGAMRTFSIHWRPASWDSVLCTVCKKAVFDRACMHYPGQKVETKAGQQEVVHFEYTDIEPVETSWVTFPAVVGTGMQRVEQELSAIRARIRATSYPPKRGINMEKIAKALGMAAQADEEQLAVEAMKLTADNAELQKTVAERDAELAKLRAENAAATKKGREAECSATVEKLCAEGRIRPGGEQEKLLRELYGKGDVELAQRLAASYGQMQPIVPVGGWQSSPGTRPGNNTPTPTAADGKVDYGAILAQMPEHIRTSLGALANDPELVVRANADFVRKTLGINVEAL